MRHRAVCKQYLLVGAFQSQTRSRSTCDLGRQLQHATNGDVSISDEKPLHMRRCGSLWVGRAPPQGFNLRREAAPHATLTKGIDACLSEAFQSQTRSRSTCDLSEG